MMKRTPSAERGAESVYFVYLNMITSAKAHSVAQEELLAILEVCFECHCTVTGSLKFQY